MTGGDVEAYLIDAYVGADGNIWASEQLYHLVDMLWLLETGNFEPEELTREALGAIARTTDIERGRERYNAMRGGDLSRRATKWWLRHMEEMTGAVPRRRDGDPQ